MRPRLRPIFASLTLTIAVFAGAGCGRPHMGSRNGDSTAGGSAGGEAMERTRLGAGAGGAGAPAADIFEDAIDPRSYEGHDNHGIPHYTTRPFTVDETALLRDAYGIEDPRRLYVSDSTEEGVLKYDTQVKRCLTCYVNSYGVGFVSVRQPDESWEEVERRVKRGPTRSFATADLPSSQSLAALDPAVRPLAERLLAAARAAGFRLRVVGTYRSPMREAFLMALGGGRTHTLTSMHSYGRALDVVVDDGVLSHARTRADWIAFRRWVPRYPVAPGQSFRILGTPERTWDWPHVELPSDSIGFGTIEEALDRARRCLAGPPEVPCNFAAHLPSRLARS